jgi:hydroxypyruvate isomerase
LLIGEINYPAIFKAIEETGYDGYMGLEYLPVNDPIDGLKILLKKEDSIK